MRPLVGGGGIPCPTNCVSCKLCKIRPKGSRYKEGGGASIGTLSFLGGSFTSSI